MIAPLRPDAVPARAPTDLETAEVHLLNAKLRAARLCSTGEMTRAQYNDALAHIGAALASVRLLAVATEPPPLRVLAAWGPRR